MSLFSNRISNGIALLFNQYTFILLAVFIFQSIKNSACITGSLGFFNTLEYQCCFFIRHYLYYYKGEMLSLLGMIAKDITLQTFKGVFGFV